MRTTSKLLALALTAALQPALADTVTLNFEDVTSSVLAGNRYSSQGVAFTGNAWGVKSNQAPCGAGGLFFSHAGSCGALLLAGTAGQTTDNLVKSFTINVADGFVTEFSFLYGLRSLSGATIKVFSGLDGGVLLNEDPLASLALTGSQCSTGGAVLFCDPNWFTSTLKFNGLAHSVVVSGIDQRLMLDDLKFITPAANGRLPEPASIALALGALGALGWARRRTAAR